MLLYDHFLTLDQEVEEIWKAKWTLPKIFFLTLRYLVPALMIIETYRKPDSFHVNLLGLIPCSLTEISGISNHEITIDVCRLFVLHAICSQSLPVVRCSTKLWEHRLITLQLQGLVLFLDDHGHGVHHRQQLYVRPFAQLTSCFDRLSA
jgi:hypothetical protein